jgi:hypothetical protein
LIAAANFTQSKDFTALTTSSPSPSPPSNFAELSQQMSVYLSSNGDDILPIVIDTGATISLTPNINDFLGPIRPSTIPDLTGLDGTTHVHGMGMVE